MYIVPVAQVREKSTFSILPVQRAIVSSRYVGKEGLSKGVVKGHLLPQIIRAQQSKGGRPTGEVNEGQATGHGETLCRNVEPGRRAAKGEHNSIG